MEAINKEVIGRAAYAIDDFAELQQENARLKVDIDCDRQQIEALQESVSALRQRLEEKEREVERLIDPAGGDTNGQAQAWLSVCTALEKVGVYSFIGSSAAHRVRAVEFIAHLGAERDRLAGQLAEAAKSHQRQNAYVAQFERLFCDEHLDNLPPWTEADEPCVSCRLAASERKVVEADMALRMWQERMQRFGEWDDGCFYYAGRSASELQDPISVTGAYLAGRTEG